VRCAVSCLHLCLVPVRLPACLVCRTHVCAPLCSLLFLFSCCLTVTDGLSVPPCARDHVAGRGGVRSRRRRTAVHSAAAREAAAAHRSIVHPPRQVSQGLGMLCSCHA
jgi:hypothetical protein